MKKSLILVIICLCLLLTGCGNKYKGYWCNYDETATIVVLLDRDNTEKEREIISNKIEEFQNVIRRLC